MSMARIQGVGSYLTYRTSVTAFRHETVALQKRINQAIDQGKISGPRLVEDGLEGPKTRQKLKELQAYEKSHPAKKPNAPKTPEKSANGGVLRVSKALPYHVDTSRTQETTTYAVASEKSRDELEKKHQSERATIAPGKFVARDSLGGIAGIRQLRDAWGEPKVAVEGLKKTSTGWSVPTVKNPAGAKASFDPLAFMPNVVFASDEDSFPVRPNFDGKGNTSDDADHYKHGTIGGNQPLTAAYSVAKKGEYVVMTYSYYYVDNKFTNYHRTDSSTISVYLKPGANGRLKPEYLYTSYHFGADLTKWEDLKKGPDGRPVVRVERGSHALHPYGKSEALPTKGLWINGDGTTLLNGEKKGNRLTLLTPQTNVAHATPLDPKAKAKDLQTMNSYFEKYPERTNPIHPKLFTDLADPRNLRRALVTIKQGLRDPQKIARIQAKIKQLDEKIKRSS